MAKKGLMSSKLKEEISKQLGLYDIVKKEGWGAVSSRDCGNIVRKAIEIAEKNMVQGV
ncbi:small, acid-soluble spore protein, alpha/beta type [Caloranaerobacter sp. TR13]|uniref:small, acid-soluble spore protein, alpha/beta type n=1 Tax=Caloranaerobacter sp. TR13 TaxID=1302151 RepID=UPI0009EC4E79|nr:small, acid-soluble spore protein, alpha/beta type [Caloranaerobacter sp. TR13]